MNNNYKDTTSETKAMKSKGSDTHGILMQQ